MYSLDAPNNLMLPGQTIVEPADMQVLPLDQMYQACVRPAPRSGYRLENGTTLVGLQPFMDFLPSRTFDRNPVVRESFNNREASIRHLRKVFATSDLLGKHDSTIIERGQTTRRGLAQEVLSTDTAGQLALAVIKDVIRQKARGIVAESAEQTHNSLVKLGGCVWLMASLVDDDRPQSYYAAHLTGVRTVPTDIGAAIFPVVQGKSGNNGIFSPNLAFIGAQPLFEPLISGAVEHSKLLATGTE